MFQFIFAGLLATLLAYLSQYDKKNILLFLSLLVIWYIAAFQDNIGVDFESYLEGFNNYLQGNVKASFIRTDRGHTEIGWFLLCKGIGTIFPSFYAVTPIVYGFILYSVYRILKYVSPQWRWLAIFYYYFGVKLFLFNMSGMRQSVAIAFWVLLAFSIKDKKIVSAVLYSILGISFHTSFLFSLPFVLFLFIPEDKINISRHPIIWAFGILAVFSLGFLYIQNLFVGVGNVFSFLLNETEAVDIYSYYVQQEMELRSFKLRSFVVQLILLSFLILAFVSKRDDTKYSGTYILLYIISFILFAIFGDFGSFPRIFMYIGIFGVGAIAVAAQKLKGPVQVLMAVYVIIYSMYYFFSALQTTQYQAFLNYHTIFQ